MHVLHIIESLTAGGKERQLVELLKGMDRGGDASTLVVMSNDIAYDLSELQHSSMVRLERRVKRDLGVVNRLFTLVQERKPDVIHSWGSMCSVFAAPVAKVAGLPFVNGIIRDAPQNLDWRSKDYRRARITFPFSEAIIGNSKAGLQAYRAPGARSQCIYNGFDTDRLLQIRSPAQVRAELSITTPYVVGMTASFSPRKDYRSFFEVAKTICGMREDVTFLAIGDGEQLDAFRRAYPQDAFPRIRILGRRPDVESLAAACDIGVLMSNASVHGEGIPNAVMEFMAVKRPVIVSESGGIGELITTGETGFIVPDQSIDALMEKILFLLDDPDLARRMGDAAMTRITTDFSLARMVDSHRTLYSRLANGRAG